MLQSANLLHCRVPGLVHGVRLRGLLRRRELLLEAREQQLPLRDAHRRGRLLPGVGQDGLRVTKAERRQGVGGAGGERPQRDGPHHVGVHVQEGEDGRPAARHVQGRAAEEGLQLEQRVLAPEVGRLGVLHHLLGREGGRGGGGGTDAAAERREAVEVVVPGAEHVRVNVLLAESEDRFEHLRS